MRRHPFHDYKSPNIYHITIKKADYVPVFSSISGNPQMPLLSLFPIGEIIQKNILAISNLEHRIRMLQYIIMPDHVHLLLRVMEYLDEALGIHISKMKIRTLQMAREKGIYNQSIFESNFHDRFLRKDHSLDVVYQYIRQNPYRLLIRRYYPEYFRRVNYLFDFKNMKWQAYGNMHLLANPFKEAVVCHRADAGTNKEKNLETNWMYTASNGEVLISPFIASKEKEVREMAEDMNGRVILITNKAFGERYKPAKHDFEQCELGNLLIIAPTVSMADGRETWVFLNKLAEDIAERKLGF